MNGYAIAVIAVIFVTLVGLLFTSSSPAGGGHICKRCGRLTYANDDDCGWCGGKEK